jgi:NADPH:quinone reductase-like Zn-dependent oxidoreductase
MTELAERINNLAPEKLEILMQKIRRGKGLPGPSAIAPARSKKRPFRPLEDKNYRLEIAKPGIFETLEVNVCPRDTPGPGQVEIEVYATGLNFRDVMVALGSYPVAPGTMQPAIGVDFAGKVVAIGPEAGSVRVGDEVMGMSDGTFTKYLTTHYSCLMPKPPNFTFEQAAAVPCIFETVQYALIEVAHLCKGESVLIHSAAGGVGLAAIQVANSVGAEIFTTVGTPEKRQFLQSLGIKNIFDSRSTSFADDIMKATGEQGVDVILNSLAGESIAKGFAILRPWGRFLELGKRDLAANAPLGMFPFLRGASFTGINLGLMAPDKKPELAARMHGDLNQRFRDGIYKPLPLHTYPISDAASAFGYMMQGKHIGKIVFTLAMDVMVTPAPN